MKILLKNTNLVFQKKVEIPSVFSGVINHVNDTNFSVAGFTPETNKSYRVYVKSLTIPSMEGKTASLYFKRSSVVSNVEENITIEELNNGISKIITSTQNLGVTINLYFTGTASLIDKNATFEVKVYEV